MLHKFILFIEGIIIGIAKIIPGVSGAILAISFGIYDRGIEAITNFFDNIYKNTIFLLEVGLGVIIGIILFGKVINYTLNNHYLITMLFFLGLIIGGLPNIAKRIKYDNKNIIIICFSFIIVLFLSFSNVNNNYTLNNNFLDTIIFSISGFLEALGTIMPGLSSTALLMMLGTYDIYIEIIANLTDFNYLINNLNFLLSFGIGFMLGIITISLLISLLFKKHSNRVFSCVLGVLLASIVILVYKSFLYNFKLIDLIIGLILLVLGTFISYKFDK